jgi:hypothetical protein
MTTKTPTTPPVGTVNEVNEALTVLKRFDRTLQAMPHAMAQWIIGCLATQYSEDIEE